MVVVFALMIGGSSMIGNEIVSGQPETVRKFNRKIL
jgi:hypothetical protein